MPVAEEAKLEIIARFRESLHKHLADSTEDFNRWFFENRDGLVHQISMRKCGPGPIDRSVVRQVVLDLVFQALRYTGQCVDVQMRAFVRAIEPRLGPEERAVFELIYFGQPWLAGIPLVVLHRYFPPLREAVEDLWLDPKNSEKAGVLLRVLQYHAEMVSKRRETERVAEHLGNSPQHFELAPNDLGPTADTSLEELLFDLDELGKKLTRTANVRCECGTKACRK